MTASISPGYPRLQLPLLEEEAQEEDYKEHPGYNGNLVELPSCHIQDDVGDDTPYDSLGNAVGKGHH